MRDPFQWTIGIGRWGGLAVRLHVFFVALAAATLYLLPGIRELRGDGLGIAAAALILLFVSVLIHELSHAWVARHAGIPVDTITLGPLGGLTSWRSAEDPRVELATLAAGPLANLAVAFALTMAVLLRHPSHELGPLWNPLWPALRMDAFTQCLAFGLWINWLLFLLNLLPAHPFDGGRILRAVLLLARPTWTDERVADVTCRVALGLSAVFAVAGVILAHESFSLPYPIWSVLLLLAVVLLVSARRDLLAIEGSASHEAPPDRTDAAAEDLVDRLTRARARLAHPPRSAPAWEPDEQEDAAEAESSVLIDREALEAEEERQVDGILSRLHAHGMDSLTAAERRLLQRVSARYRSRLGKRS